MKYRVGNVQLVCPCCQNDTFDKDYRQLNTRGATLFGLDWANRDATILICRQCSYISWFMKEPEAVR
ncbi:hypothetical protein ABZ756_02875 [Mammaliicoccus sciuri]|uniref:DNA-binding protein n=1 Tax=Sporosarcina newyorkensis 2681 TaxID=1027292 RepID=F9DYD1_9BACL|nr:MULTISPECIES: hypothetical protein [Sporosarcina]EGQ18149.1 hypothetical protein HMPREF9372_3812 [Sporosarcina newyorkensis 2681]MBY0222596.1 hypothetical protein [Sporosarcina aquimarina]